MSGMKIRVQKKNPAGDVTYEYEGELLNRDEHVLVLEALHEEVVVTASATGQTTTFESFNSITSLDTVEIAKQFIERAKTSRGLRVTASILDKVYQTGRKCAEDFRENMKILFDEYLPKWNYRVLPDSPMKSGSSC